MSLTNQSELVTRLQPIKSNVLRLARANGADSRKMPISQSAFSSPFREWDTEEREGQTTGREKKNKREARGFYEGKS